MTQEEQDRLIREADRLIADADPKIPFKVISTKVEAGQAELFEKICEREGVSVYEKVQQLIDCYIRLKDAVHVVNSMMNKLRIAFEIRNKIEQRLRLADPSAKYEVREATYYLAPRQEYTKDCKPIHQGKVGMRMIHLYDPFMGEVEMTENVQFITGRFIECLPVVYESLEKGRLRKGDNTMYEYLCSVSEELDGSDFANEVDAEEFKPRYGTKMENGKEMAEAPYRRTMRRDPDSQAERLRRMEERQTSLWSDEDQIDETF